MMSSTQPADTLSSALERLAELEKLATETRSVTGCAVENLAGISPPTGAESATATPLASGFIAQLHRSISRLEDVLRDTSRGAGRLLDLTSDTRPAAMQAPHLGNLEGGRMTGRNAA